jgi:hypothetical protein
MQVIVSRRSKEATMMVVLKEITGKGLQECF